MNKRIFDYLVSLGVEGAEEKSGLLERYTDEIMLFNPTLKLVASKDKDEIVLRHILDCVSAYSVFCEETKDGERIADLGSGAGLPGIVLSILFPGRTFFLIERMQRRVGFLRTTSALLGLGNTVIYDRDIKEIKERFDALTCRAFHPLYDIARDGVRLSDKAILYKGTEKNISLELERLGKEGYNYKKRIKSVRVPGLEEERNIVVLDSWRKTNEER